MSGEEKKALDDYLGTLIQQKFEEWQNNCIKKDLKNGKQNIAWKDLVGVTTIVLSMLAVIYYSAQANTKSEVVAAELSVRTKVNDSQYGSLEKRLDRIESKLDRIVTKGGKE